MDEVKLNNWVVADDTTNPYAPPESRKIRLGGEVQNHPKFSDGMFVFPSSPVEFDRDTRMFRSYSGKIYRIGSPKPEYAETYSDMDVESVLFDSLEQNCDPLNFDE